MVIDEIVKNIPNGWTTILIKDGIKKIALTGKKLKQNEYKKTGKVPVIDQGHLFIGGYTDNIEKKISVGGPMIIFGDHTKIIKYVPFDFVPGADGIKVIIPFNAFVPKLFYYFLHLIKFPDKGYARHFQFVEKSIIPLPPKTEQLRILEKIEEMLTKIDSGVEALEKVKAQLKRYRQAVLKAAFTGELTIAWREKHQGPDVNADLRSINNENDLPMIPLEWRYMNLEELSELKNGINFSKEQKQDNGILTIDVFNMYIKGIFIDINDLYRVKKVISKEYLLSFGDILFVRSSVKREGVGWASAFKDYSEPVTFCGFIIRARLNIKKIEPSYCIYYMRSNFSRDFIIKSSNQVTITNINQEALKKIPIPIPPIIEQHQIVSEIERRFSVADEVGKTVDNAVKQAKRLRQSILKMAFEGKLVPQDPNDEPAEKLLERIRAEKAKMAETKKIRKKK